MSENLRNFTAAVYGFDAVVQRMPADAWAADSACEGWSGKDLLQHQVAVLNGVTKVASTGQMAAPTPPEDMSDPVKTWNQCRDEVLSALDQPGVLQQQGPFWFDAPTVDDMIGIVQWDPLAHAWDLAKTCDMDACLNESVAASSLATIEGMQPMLVKSGRIGEPVEVPSDAPASARFLGATGRNPS
ncbi:MAG: maleylpyruvate isomerase N-terminal domain-containing protein [Acidimicrobiales bacterium]